MTATAAATSVSFDEKKYSDNKSQERRILVPCRDTFHLRLKDGTVHHVFVNYLAIEIPKWLSKVITPREIKEQYNLACWATVESADDFFANIALPPSLDGVKKEDIDYSNSRMHHFSFDSGKEFADSNYSDVERIICMPYHGIEINELDITKQTVLSDMVKNIDPREILRLRDLPEIEKMRKLLEILLKNNDRLTDPDAIEGLRTFVERWLSYAINNNYNNYTVEKDSFSIERSSNGRRRGYHEFGKAGDKLTDEEKRLAKKLFLSDKEQITPGFAFFLENGGWINHIRKRPIYDNLKSGEILGKSKDGMDYTYSISKKRTGAWGEEYSIRMILNEDGTLNLSCELEGNEVSYEQLIEARPDFNPTDLQIKIAILLSEGINIRNLPQDLRISKYTISTLREAINIGLALSNIPTTDNRTEEVTPQSEEDMPGFSKI